MSARIRASLVLTGRSCAKDSIPASCEELRLLRTYTLEAGSSPTCTTASPRRRPWRPAPRARRSRRAPWRRPSCRRAAPRRPRHAALPPQCARRRLHRRWLLERSSVAVVIGFVGTGFVHADVARLAFAELRELRVELRQLQPRNFLIQLLGQH